MRAAGPTDKPLISFFSGKKREGKKFLFCFPAVLICFLNRLKCKRGLQGKKVFQIEKIKAEKRENKHSNIQIPD
jgi:hypothetical protein